ncbi:MAG TPA: fibronectin type III domain-containing protein [Candidatus Polarisedimenticolia bacterium]|nr:fibronectin type III domain-containing protein [Candidatus Polarisedimenticolia bacterium]
MSRKSFRSSLIRSLSLLPAAVVVAFVAWMTTAPALALAPRSSEDLDKKVIPAPYLLPIPEQAQDGAPGPASAAAAAFERRHGGAWTLTFDRRTGRLSLLEGEGLPLFPGRGNGLTPAQAGLDHVPAKLDDVEPLGRAFLDAERDLLRPQQGELRLNPDRSAWLEDGALVYLDYDWFVDDIPVEGARVFLRARHGNIVQAGTQRLGAGLPRSGPALDADAALARLFAHANGRRDDDIVVEEPHLVYVARSAAEVDVPWGGGVRWFLAWRAAFQRAGDAATWGGDVDARTGDILAFEDRNRYARVTGGVHPRTVTDPEQERPFTNLRVVTSAGGVNTGDAGTFAYTGGVAFTSMDGTFFRPFCIGCAPMPRAFAWTDRGTGDLDFGTGGVDQFGNGVSTPAERDAFYHQNRARLLASKWLAIAWFATTVRTTVNIPDVCNAFWDGAGTNFFRSGSGCNNTGEIADVMYHEWGHGLDQNTNIGDGSTGEATGDINSMSIVHDPNLGPGFSTNGDPVRILDSNLVGYQARVNNLDTFCFVCAAGQCSNGPFGHEVHCEGEIYGQTHWDLAQALVARYGFNTGWQVAERLFYASLPQADTMNPVAAQSTYSAYLAVDDDDGNIANGTPNCVQIFNAFSTHGIAPSTPCFGNTPACTRPAQPSLTATPGHGKVVLDWTTSATAANYQVLRAEFSPTQAYLPMGAVQVGTHFEDTTAQPGVSYSYVIEARTSGGCRSTIENAVTAAALPDGRLAIGPVVVDDIPAGNRSGDANPGESIDLTVPLVNDAPAGAVTAASATMSSGTPNVTIVNGASSYGSIPVGATANGTAYRAALGAALACGQTINTTLAINPGDGGGVTTAFVPVLLGSKKVVRYFEDFESDFPAWTTSAGTPAATTGAWVQAVPSQPSSQDPITWAWSPSWCAGGSGQCLITQQNSGALGNETVTDVDSGETITTSPIIDLTGAVAARLSYKRWWADSSLTDTGDSLIVEVSGNGGSSWVAAETVGPDARNLGWQPVEVRLESLVPMTSTFRIRVRARDTNLDTIVEAGIDDVEVDEVQCDLTPVCTTAPTFAGLASATPGASCAETDLAWSAASTHCQNASIQYSVYRSTSAGFTPAAQNRVASGVATTGFHDTLLQPGTNYHYIVRADDSRSGEDANTVDRNATAPTTPDTVSPVFPGLGALATGTGCGDTALQWSPAAETCSTPVHYNVYRSTTSGFTPGPANLVASVLDTSYVDRALQPQQTYFYKVRAADAKGNEDTNALQRSAAAHTLPLVFYQTSFENSDGGWFVTAPNDATKGNWQWGDPQGTGPQPEDDATPAPGTNAWITGLQGGGVGDWDVDGGTTTLISPTLDLTGRSGAILRMALFYNNTAGANPGEDPLHVDVTSNNGTTWTPLLNSPNDIAPWTLTPFTLTGTVPFTNQFRIRVTAADLGVGGSIVEAGVDDVSIEEPGAACNACSGPVGTVGLIQVSRSGDDILLDWSADPVNAGAYVVYQRSGPGLATLVRLGSTTTRSFVHAGAALLTGQDFDYVVSAVDACGRESAAY